MSNNNPLPDYIEVANISNLFWNNNSDLYPTRVPTGYRVIEKTRPTFLSPYLGTCILTGEFNHCLYNGKYYFLTKIEVIDVQSERYKYQLDYDVMINFMSAGTNVKGTLIRTDREDILEGCLQTTKAILADPIDKKIYSNLSKKEETWQERLELKLFDEKTLSTSLSDYIMTRESFAGFIHRVKNNPIANNTKNKTIDTSRFKYWDPYKSSDPLVILDSLELIKTPQKWKIVVLGEFLTYLTENVKNFVVVKQTTPTDHFNVGGYVIGRKDHTLGANITTEVYPQKIDLSGLTDVVPIDNKTKNPLEPNRTPTYQMLGHSTTVKRIQHPYVLLRRPYLPIGNNKTTEGTMRSPGQYASRYDETGILPAVDTPQKIVTKDDTVGYLWYLDKNNYNLIDYPREGKARLGLSSYNDSKTKWAWMYTDYKNIAPLGFLIFQLDKRRASWDDITYTGLGINTLTFRTGLSKTEIEKTYINSDTDKWWANVDPSLETVWGHTIFTRINLDIDQFNWLSIAPSYKGLGYKWYYSNYWGYQKFFPDAGRVEKWYPSVINRSNIKYNNIVTDNPYSYTDPNIPLPAWLVNREGKLHSISKYDHVKAPFEITKGDIVVSSLEHRWYYMKETLRAFIPYKITNKEWIYIIKTDITSSLDIGVDDIDIKHWNVGESTGAGVILGLELAVVGGLLGVLISYLTLGAAAPAVVAAYASAVSGQAAAAATGSALAFGALSGAVLGFTLDMTGAFDRDNEVKLAEMINVLPYTDENLYVDPKIQDGSIVLYLYRGQYRIGIFKRHRLNLELNKDIDNWVESVNGNTDTELDIFIIRPLENGVLDYNQDEVISDTLKSDIIQYGMGTSGGINKANKVHYYTQDELKVGTHTFDLVGTDWYVVVHNGTYNLVPKNDGVLSTIKDEGKIISIQNDISVYAKINQKAEFNYYGQVFPLNTKFKFNEQVKYSLKPLVPDTQYSDPDVEYKWLYLELKNDKLDVVTTIPRKQTRSAEKVDSTQVLLMKENLLRLATNYEQDRYANQIMMEERKLAMARQREDLESNWLSSTLGVAGKAATLAASVGVGVATGGVGATAGAAGLGALGSIGSMKSDIEFLIKYPTLMKRIGEDERSLHLSNSQKMYQRKSNYEHDFRYQTLKLNKASGAFHKPGVSNRDAQERYNKERRAGDVSIDIYIPTEAQQTQIDYIYKTFGCECISDYFEEKPLVIQSNMDPGIYKFSRIECDGIISLIKDITLRDILRQILENGVKFSDCKIDTADQAKLFRVDKTPTLPGIHPEIDPTKISEWPSGLWDVFKTQKTKEEIIKIIKGLAHYGLTDDEWSKNKDTIRTDTDDHLFEDIDKIIRGREGGQVVVIGQITPEPGELQKRLEELTTKVADLEAQLAQCEQEKGDKHKDKEDLQQKLNEAQAEIDKVKKQLSDLQTEKQEVDRELADCRQNIETYSQDIESLNEQLRKCKVDLDNAVKAQETVGTVNTAEIKTLRAKVKELEATIASKTADLDSLKKECDDTKKKLTDEIQSHKEDKEDLTQQLNNERRIVLNKTDEVNRLTKEKENLENQKFDIERQLRECVEAKDKIQKELNKCKKDKPKRPKPSTIPNECPLMRDILNDPYEIDIKQREGGLSRFIDLIIVVADAIKWMRRSGLDAILMRNDTIRPIVQKLEAFEQIPIVDKIEDITRDPNWDKFLKEINKTNLHNHPDQDVRAIYDRMREVSSMQGLYVVHGVKAALDDLNYLTYKAKETLAEELKTDTNLQQFFKHTYPGNSLPIYTEIFGSPDNAIVRKRFIDEVQCKPDGSGESVITILDRLNKGTDHSVEEVPAPPGVPTYMGIPLTRNKRFFIQPFNWFRDAKRPAGVAAFKKGTAPNGIPWNGIEAYNYPYTITDAKNPNKKDAHAVWVTFYNEWGGSNSNSYVLKQTGNVAAIRDAVLHLWRTRDKAQFPEDLLPRLTESNKTYKLIIEMAGIQQHGVYQRNSTVLWGKESVVKGLDSYNKDILKLIIILSRCGWSVAKWGSGTDSGGYSVIDVAGQWTNDWANIKTDSGWGSAATYYVKWMMPTEYADDLKNNLDNRLGTGNITNRQAAMYRLISWMYAVVSQPDQAEDLIRMMFDPTTPFGKFLDFKARS